MIKSPSCPEFACYLNCGPSRRRRSSQATAGMARGPTPVFQSTKTTNSTNSNLNVRALNFPSSSSKACICQAMPYLLNTSSLMASNIMPSLTLPQAIQDEFQLEGSMHVTWFSAVSCEAAYGLPQIMSAPETSILEENELHELIVKMDESSGSTGSVQTKLRKGDMSVKSLAACLATPSEGIPDSPERPLQQSRVSNTNLSITRSSATTAGGVYEKEEKCEAEECYWGMAGTSEQLSAAEMRWRDWMRRIRRKRISEKIQSLLMKVVAAPAALFSSDSS